MFRQYGDGFRQLHGLLLELIALHNGFEWLICAMRLAISRGYADLETNMNMDKRQKGFESKFAHDEEMLFKANARRAKLLGLWAAEKLGLSGAEADAYAKAMVVADFEEAGTDDLFRKVRADFDAKKVEQSDHQIQRQIDDLLAVAVEQIKAG
jgi:hypothetical protein